MSARFLTALTICTIAAPAFGQDNTTSSQATKPTRVAVVCFKTGEKVSGMNKICYYDCLGSEAAITIRSVELCPLSIRQ